MYVCKFYQRLQTNMSMIVHVLLKFWIMSHEKKVVSFGSFPSRWSTSNGIMPIGASSLSGQKDLSYARLQSKVCWIRVCNGNTKNGIVIASTDKSLAVKAMVSISPPSLRIHLTKVPTIGLVGPTLERCFRQDVKPNLRPEIGLKSKWCSSEISALPFSNPPLEYPVDSPPGDGLPTWSLVWVHFASAPPCEDSYDQAEGGGSCGSCGAQSNCCSIEKWNQCHPQMTNHGFSTHLSSTFWCSVFFREAAHG